MNAAFWPAGQQGVDGLVVRVGNTASYGPTGLAAVRRVGNASSSFEFEHVDESKMIVPCPVINSSSGNHHGKTAVSPGL